MAESKVTIVSASQGVEHDAGDLQLMQSAYAAICAYTGMNRHATEINLLEGLTL